MFPIFYPLYESPMFLILAAVASLKALNAKTTKATTAQTEQHTNGQKSSWPISTNHL